MALRRIAFLLLLILIAGIVHAQAQDDAAKATAATPPPTDMEKWIKAVEAPYQAAYKRDVTDVFDTDIGKLKSQYVATLDAAIAKASSAGDLDGALALRNEKKRFSETNAFPEQDDTADAPAVKQMRTTARAQFARLENERAGRAKQLYAKYDQVLSQAQVQLTQHHRLDDALLVKTKREEIALAWLGSSPSKTVSVAEHVESAKPASALPATREQPFAANTVNGQLLLEAKAEVEVYHNGIKIELRNESHDELYYFVKVPERTFKAGDVIVLHAHSPYTYRAIVAAINLPGKAGQIAVKKSDWRFLGEDKNPATITAADIEASKDLLASLRSDGVGGAEREKLGIVSQSKGGSEWVGTEKRLNGWYCVGFVLTAEMLKTPQP